MNLYLYHNSNQKTSPEYSLKLQNQQKTTFFPSLLLNILFFQSNSLPSLIPSLYHSFPCCWRFLSAVFDLFSYAPLRCITTGNNPISLYNHLCFNHLLQPSLPLLPLALLHYSQSATSLISGLLGRPLRHNPDIPSSPAHAKMASHVFRCVRVLVRPSVRWSIDL